MVLCCFPWMDACSCRRAVRRVDICEDLSVLVDGACTEGVSGGFYSEEQQGSSSERLMVLAKVKFCLRVLVVSLSGSVCKSNPRSILVPLAMLTMARVPLSKP